MFKSICFIPVSCDVIVYMNTNAAVFDLNSVTKCPVRPNFMRCVSMSKLKNKKKIKKKLWLSSHCLWFHFWHCKERKLVICCCKVIWSYFHSTFTFTFTFIPERLSVNQLGSNLVLTSITTLTCSIEKLIGSKWKGNEGKLMLNFH